MDANLNLSNKHAPSKQPPIHALLGGVQKSDATSFLSAYD